MADPSESPQSQEDKPPSASEAIPADESRRSALQSLVVLGSAGYAAGLAVPAVGYLAPKLSSSDEPASERWFRVVRLSALQEGVTSRVKVVGDAQDAFTISRNQTLGSVWLKRQGEAVTALSAECPHLGCAISINSAASAFSCPCHTSRFSLVGKAQSGPSPRDMDELATRLVDGWVEVAFKRFRQGVGTKVEVK